MRSAAWSLRLVVGVTRFVVVVVGAAVGAAVLAVGLLAAPADRASGPAAAAASARYRFEQAMQAGARSLESGQASDAERHFSAAVEFAEGGLTPADRAAALDRLGVARVFLGRPGEARPCLEQALELRRKLGVSAEPALAESCLSLGALLEGLGELPAADALLRESLGLRERVVALGGAPGREAKAGFATTLLTLAGVCWKRDAGAEGAARTEGDALARRGLAMAESMLGGRGRRFASILAGLGRRYLDLRRFDAASATLARALAVAAEASGERSADVLPILVDLSRAERGAGRMVEALEHAQRSLSLIRELRGPDDPAAGDALFALAEAHQAAGEGTLAREAAAQGLEVYQKAFGAHGGRVLDVERRFAALLVPAGEEPEPAGPRKPCPAEVRELLRGWRAEASQALERRDFHAAERRFREALEALGSYEGVDDLFLICAYGLGMALKEQARPGEAEPWYRRAVAAAERMGAGSAPGGSFEDLLEGWAEALDGQGRGPEARRAYGRALVARAERAAAEPAALASMVKAWNDAGVDAFERGRLALAEALLSTAVAVAGQNGMKEPYVVSLRNHGWLLTKLGRQAEAEPVLRRAQEVGREVYGEGSPEAFEVAQVHAESLWAGGATTAGARAAAEVERRALGPAAKDPERRARLVRTWLARAAGASATTTSGEAVDRGAALAAAELARAAVSLAEAEPRLELLLPVAHALLGRAVEATAPASAPAVEAEASAAFERAYGGFLAVDGSNSPGLVWAELAWVAATSRRAGSAAALALRDRLLASEATCPRRAPALDGAWVALFEVLGLGSAVPRLADGFGTVNRESIPLLPARLAARLTLTAICARAVP